MDSILGQEDPLEESMATHSSILAWRIPWIGAWQATIHGVTKKLDTTEQLNSSSLVPYITDRNIQITKHLGESLPDCMTLSKY